MRGALVVRAEALAVRAKARAAFLEVDPTELKLRRIAPAHRELPGRAVLMTDCWARVLNVREPVERARRVPVRRQQVLAARGAPVAPVPWRESGC